MCPGSPFPAAGVRGAGHALFRWESLLNTRCSWVSRGSFRNCGWLTTSTASTGAYMEWLGAGRALRALPVAGASPGVGTGADRLPGRARDPPRRCPQRCVRDSARAVHNVAADGPALPVRGPSATDLAASRVRTGRHHASHLPGGRFPWGLAFNDAAVVNEGFGVSCGDVLRPERGPLCLAGELRGKISDCLALDVTWPHRTTAWPGASGESSGCTTSG